MSFLFYLRWSLYHPIIILSFLFYLRWMLCHPVYSKYTLFFDKRQAKKKNTPEKSGLSTASKLQLAEFTKHFLVSVSTSFLRMGLFPSFAKEFFRFICTLAFKVHGDIDFLLPSHIAFPCFIVRLVPQI